MTNLEQYFLNHVIFHLFKLLITQTHAQTFLIHASVKAVLSLISCFLKKIINNNNNNNNLISMKIFIYIIFHITISLLESKKQFSKKKKSIHALRISLTRKSWYAPIWLPFFKCLLQKPYAQIHSDQK
jgi:glucose-6-phosphate-specific signal transduction histidine kinase